MATSTGALPALPTGMSIADPEIQEKYNQSIENVLKALENRGGTNWFQIAGALANPGRTGSAAEAFGRAMDVVGQQRAEEEKQALPIAQMRAQLAGQQYEMSKEAKALNAFASIFGASPQDLQTGMIPGQYNPAMMQKLNAAMPMFYGSPKIMEMAKTMFGQFKDMSNLLLEERKAGMTEADLIAKYGPEIVPMIRGMSGVQPTSTTGQAGTSGAGGTTAQPQGQFDFSSIVSGGTLTSPYGPRAGVAHNGIDIGASLNAPITAPVAGEVVFAGNGGDKAGNMVTIRDADGKLHSFMHMNEVGVKVGDTVDPASPIGLVGATGNARGAHIHYEVKGADGKPVNPLDMFRVTPPPAAGAGGTGGQVRTATEMMSPPKIEADRIVLPDTGEVLAERGTSSLADWSKLKEATLADYNKRRAEDIKFEREQISGSSKERSESFATRIKEVGSINPDDILRTKGLYDALDNLVNTDKDMEKALGLLMKQGAGAAMYELAKNGVRINNFGIGVDAYPAFVKNLPPEKQEKLRQMDMILSTIFIQKAKDGKSAFGPSISNSDIITQKEQMASIRDTAKIINGWLTQERAIADHRLDVAEAYDNFVTSAEGTNKKPYQFFSSKEYKDISKKYGQKYRDLALVTYGAPK